MFKIQSQDHNPIIGNKKTQFIVFVKCHSAT